MPDSEEERRNRDKFVRERDYGDRNRNRDFNDRGRRDYANGLSSGLKRMSNRREDEFMGGSVGAPAAKRNRFDSASDSFEPQFVHREDENHTAMLTFRRFLATQDESTLGSEEEAIAKYLEYKLHFKKRECNKYFQEHKEEEWFRLKYHPEDSKSRKEENQGYVQKRLDVFNEFLESGRIGKFSLDFLNAADIIRLMDAVVVKLEGGTDDAVAEIDNEVVEDESAVEAENLKEELKKAESDNSDSTTTAPSNGNGGSADKEMKENGSDDAVEKKETSSEEIVKKKKLHKTCSIHFKNIPTNAKFTDLENICKQHPGLLRVGLTDPLPEAKLHRHGWVTYRRDVNIKEIFWGLKNAKLNGVELGAVVNRDLKRRVRAVSGVTLYRGVTQNDIRQAAKLIALYDHKARLFVDDDALYAPLEDLEKAIVQSKNPLLDGAVEYLVEESSAEEEAYLGASSMNVCDDLNILSAPDATYPLEIDEKLLAVLDKYLLYLRIVHSVDYYNCSEYINEDSMPNRLGLIHVRGVKPSSTDSYVTISTEKNAAVLLKKKFVDDYIEAHNRRLSSTLLHIEMSSEEELEKLGKRDAEKAVQEFIDANCVELAKDKWLCPLSGKKFKGPEFILKHLQSKHNDKLNEVRDEVLFYNNFLVDPQKPRNPDPPKPLSQASPAQLAGTDFDRQSSLEAGRLSSGSGSGYRGGGWNNRFGSGRGGFSGGARSHRYFDNQQMAGGGTGMADIGGVRKDPRQQIPYRDLDAPEEIF